MLPNLYSENTNPPDVRDTSLLLTIHWHNAIKLDWERCLVNRHFNNLKKKVKKCHSTYLSMKIKVSHMLKKFSLFLTKRIKHPANLSLSLQSQQQGWSDCICVPRSQCVLNIVGQDLITLLEFGNTSINFGWMYRRTKSERQELKSMLKKRACWVLGLCKSLESSTLQSP